VQRGERLRPATAHHLIGGEQHAGGFRIETLVVLYRVPVEGRLDRDYAAVDRSALVVCGIHVAGQRRDRRHERVEHTIEDCPEDS
jgi:hypothetical protein